jgi:hypothetical protein
MRLAVALIAAAAVLLPASADAQGRGHGRRDREQDAAFQAMQEGRILPLGAILSRVRIPGAQYIGAEFNGAVYRLKYMRGGEVIWIDVDARTGRVLGRVR